MRPQSVPELEALRARLAIDDLDVEVLRPAHLPLPRNLVVLAREQVHAHVGLVGHVEVPRTLAHEDDPVVGDDHLLHGVRPHDELVDPTELGLDVAGHRAPAKREC